MLGPVCRIKEAKMRPWSKVWRVETADAVHFAKQNCVAQSFEAAVLQELSMLAPDHVVPISAVDLDRGLLLTPDQGPTFRETGADDVVAWCRLARDGALLQREVTPGTDRLETAGLTRQPALTAPAYVESFLERWQAAPRDDPRHVSQHDASRLRTHLPVVRRWAEQVAALGLPVTLNHNDLHDQNVFHVEDRLVFFDFADALLTEPLQVLLIPLQVLQDRLDCGPDDPRLQRVADSALEVWSDLAPLEELRGALPAALRLAGLGRCESWIRVTEQMSPAELDDYGAAASAWLLSLVEQSSTR